MGNDGFDEVIVVVRPLIPAAAKVAAAVSEVLDSQVLTNDGPSVARLERIISAETGVADVAVTASGTTAIQLACSALDLRGEVLVPAAGFPATAQAVLRAGAIPVAVDVEDGCATIDPGAVAAAVNSRTCAILGVHAFGCPADVEGLRAVADAAGVPLLFDAATCWGIGYRGRPLLSYGDVAMLSLHATKLAHSIEGGAVFGNTMPVAAKVRRLRNFGLGPDGALRTGTNGRMSELHAAFGAVVLAEVRAEVRARIAVRERYEAALAGLDWLRPCEFRPEAGPNVAAMPVRLAPDAPVDAEGLCAALLGLGIHARAYFAGRYRIDGLRRAGPTPNADAIADRIVCLPFWGRLTEAQIARIAAALTTIARQPALAG